MAAVAGLDMALWDALAKSAGLPLARLLGGTTDPVPACNSNGLGLIPPAAAGDEALELLAEGEFTALKVRVGRAAAADDVAAVRRVREPVGDDVVLVADFNQGLDLSEALQRCRALDAEGPGLDRRAVAVVMRIGGVTGFLQAAAIADVAGIPDWADPALTCPFEVRSGMLQLPDVPGNGLQWDDDAVARHQIEL